MRAALLLGLVGLASCFAEGPADDVYSCGPQPNQCPAGYYCALNQRCRHGAAPGDGGDSTADHCTNLNTDEGETDIDCGGSCAPCDVGRLCGIDADCQTSSCAAGRCELATAPPFWRPLPSMVFDRRKPVVIATPDGQVLAIGGGDQMNAISNSVEAYDVRAGKWGSFPMTVLARSAGAGGFLDGKLYVAGGFGNEKQLESYDFQTAQWTLVQTDIGFEINDAGFSVAAGMLYVFGGFNPASTVSGDAHSLQPPTSWLSLAKIKARRAIGGTTGPDGLVYAFGGNDGVQALDVAQRYSTVSSMWADAPRLPAATDSLGAASGPDGRIYLVGGAVAGAPVATVWAFTPGRDQYASVAALQAPRASLGVATGSDGRIYAVGGLSSTVSALRDVEAYGPTVTISPAQPTASSQVTANGANFAAGAQLSVYAGDTTGTPLVTGLTDQAGAISVTLPAFGGAGSFKLTFVDNRSRYPVPVRIDVAP